MFGGKKQKIQNINWKELVKCTIDETSYIFVYLYSSTNEVLGSLRLKVGRHWLTGEETEYLLLSDGSQSGALLLSMVLSIEQDPQYKNTQYALREIRSFDKAHPNVFYKEPRDRRGSWKDYLENVNLDTSLMKQRDVEVESAILKGDFSVTFETKPRLIRVFSSSTFADTEAERNRSMEDVFPYLRLLCARFGHEFQVVDMRWGVRDASTDDHLTSKLCMGELAKCQKYSVGPNFVTFVCDRYGYRPFPPEIPKEMFEKMMAWLESQKLNEEKKKITNWYWLNANSLEPYYLLQPKSVIEPHLPKNDWWAYFEELQALFRRASAAVLPPEQARAFWMSVTQDEIHHGILDIPPEGRKNTYYFRRFIPDLDPTDPKARNFADIVRDKDGKPCFDEDGRKCLLELRDHIIPKAMEEANLKENIYDYSISWSDLKQGEASKERLRLLRGFLDKLCFCLSTGIIRSISENTVIAESSLFY